MGRGDNFGYSVAIYDHWEVVVGSPCPTWAATPTRGGLRLFEGRGRPRLLGQVAKLTAGDGAADDQFGYSVSIYTVSIDWAAAVVGAPFEDVGGQTDRGSLCL